MKRMILVARILPLLAAWAVARDASAMPKEECVDTHGRGQDLRERGQLVRARQLFLACAQSTCPALVQADCARFGEELSHLVPTVSFGARDAAAADLPGTVVYVDDVVMTSRLEDGRSFEVDPGRHVVRFVHAGKEVAVKVVLNQGEKGRLVVATFIDDAPAASASVVSPPPEPPRRPVFPFVVAGLGGAAAVTGGVLMAVGLAGVPGNCDVSSRQCDGAADDPSIDRARRSMSLANLGLGVGLAGVVALAGGLLWGFTSSSRGAPARASRHSPFAFVF